MAYRQFITWPDDLNCLVLLLFPDWMPLMWMGGVHKHAVRHGHCYRTVTQICANKETSLQEGKAEDPAACEDLTDIFYTPAWLFTCKRPVYFLQIAAAPSTQFLHMEAVPEGQQEILAHPQSFKILSWGANCTKLWTTRRKRWVYTFHRIEKSLREKGTSKGHWDGDASGACVQSRQAGPRLLGFVRCWCEQGHARDVHCHVRCWHTSALAREQLHGQTSQPPPLSFHKTQRRPGRRGSSSFSSPSLPPDLRDLALAPGDTAPHPVCLHTPSCPALSPPCSCHLPHRQCEMETIIFLWLNEVKGLWREGVQVFLSSLSPQNKVAPCWQQKEKRGKDLGLKALSRTQQCYLDSGWDLLFI